MFITLITTIAGIACSIPYALFFVQSRIAIPHQESLVRWRRKLMMGVFLRSIFIIAIFWYLLRLPMTDRILFLGAFVGGFWFIVLLSQRRYYGSD